MRGVVRIAGLGALLLLSATLPGVAADPAEKTVTTLHSPADRSPVADPATGFQPAPNGSSFDPDSVLMQVAVQPNGSARWQVEYRFQLPTEREREVFDSFRADIEANRSRYTTQFRDRINPSVAAARAETGREMAMDNVSVGVRRQRLAEPTGIVTYGFTWQAFARTNGSAIRLGDAIRGFYVGPTTTLTITWPEGYRPVRTLPEPDTERAQRLSWEGELSFGAGEPSVLLVTESSARATAADDTTAGGISPMLIGIGGLLLAALGTAGVVVSRRGGSQEENTDDESDRDMELLSDAERALAVIEDHDGRLKQQQLADACEWTDSKASRVVSDLREDDRIDVFRLGRENVISLPEVEDEN